jgi:CRP-like cAMP-binding protein
VLEPGSFLGEMSLLTGEPRTATVTAHTEALVYELGKDALEPLLAARPALLEQLSVSIAARRLAMAASSEGGDAAAGEDDLATALLGRMRSFFADVFGRSH